MKKRQQQHASQIKTLVVLGDLILANLVFFLVASLQHGGFDTALSVTNRYHYVLITLVYMICLSYSGIILDQRVVYMERIIHKATKTTALYAGAMLCSILFLQLNVLSIAYWLIYFFALMIAVTLWRLTFRIILKRYRKSGGNLWRIIILGAGSVAKEVHETIIENPVYGYKFCGFFDDRAPQDYKVDATLVKGTLNDVIDYIEKNDIDEVINALPAGDDRKGLPIMRYAENNLVRYCFIPDFKRYISKSVELTFIDKIPVANLRPEPLKSNFNKTLKRTFDIIVSLLFTVFCFPLIYIVIGSIIKLTSKGPIFFKQKRTGENGEEFNCLKFRSMKVNKDADTTQAVKGDSRVTKIGAFLRKTNLDELPQFLNVLVGNMSIVGPRPHMLSQTETYSQLIDKYMVRHYIKPGITGWAQVTGYRGETKELADMEGRIAQDVWYIENWTFWLDIKIIYVTVLKMFKGDDQAY